MSKFLHDNDNNADAKAIEPPGFFPKTAQLKIRKDIRKLNNGITMFSARCAPFFNKVSIFVELHDSRITVPKTKN